MSLFTELVYDLLDHLIYLFLIFANLFFDVELGLLCNHPPLGLVLGETLIENPQADQSQENCEGERFKQL